MYCKIVGGWERKERVKIQFSFFPEEKDEGFEQHCAEHLVDIFDPETGRATGEKGLNPCYNHLQYFSHDATDEEIKAEGERLLAIVFEAWKNGRSPVIKNDPVLWPAVADVARKAACADRVSAIQARAVDAGLKTREVK